MPSYRQLLLTPGPPLIAPAQMPALRKLEPVGPHDSQRSLDTLPSSGQRVLFEFGLRGGTKFLIPDGDDPVYMGSPRIYPDKTTPRVIGRGRKIPLTPGSIVVLELTAIPSGPRQVSDGASGWVEDGRGGQVKLEVTYENSDGDTVSRSTTIDIAPSIAAYGAEPDAAHQSLIVKSQPVPPYGLDPTAADLEKWCRGTDVRVSFRLSYIGSPRIVDGAVVEKPIQLVVDQAADRWPSAMYSENGAPYQAIPSPYPIAQITSTDPGGGTAAIGRALLEQGRQLGPCLGWFSAATEHVGELADWISYDTGTGDDECPSVSATGTSEKHIPFTSATSAINSSLPGFLLGHYARQVEHGDEFLDGVTGVLPVWFAVYAKATNGSFKIQTDDAGWSAIKVSVTGDVWDWWLEPGWLEVGTGAEDAPLARLYGSDTGGGTWHLRHAAVFMQVR